MTKFFFDLVTPEGLLLSDEVEQVDIQCSEGDMGILAGHAPVMAKLRPGVLTVITNGVKERFVVLGGTAQVTQTKMTVLANSGSALDEFDVFDLVKEIDDLKLRADKATPGRELDYVLTRLDHYKMLHRTLSYPATAF
jgi:F-type H+-transporting ATPase subunit epsilon